MEVRENDRAKRTLATPGQNQQRAFAKPSL